MAGFLEKPAILFAINMLSNIATKLYQYRHQTLFFYAQLKANPMSSAPPPPPRALPAASTVMAATTTATVIAVGAATTTTAAGVATVTVDGGGHIQLTTIN